MKKTKITKTIFNLDAVEVAFAVSAYIIKKNNYNPNFMHQAIEMQPVLSEGTELTGIEMSFTNTKK